MAKSVFINPIFAWGGRRLSMDTNMLTFSQKRAKVDKSVYEDRVDQIAAGTFAVDLNSKGFLDNDVRLRMLPLLVEAELAAGVQPFTLAPEPGGAAGTQALFNAAKCVSFSDTHPRAAMQAFEADFASDERVVDGYVMFNSVGGSGISAGVNGAIVNLGAVPAGSELILNVHVLEPPGVTGTTPTLDGKLKSAAAIGFASPTDRVTLTQMTAPGGWRYVIDGDTTPITDAYWRLVFTAPGGTGSPVFFVLAAAGVRVK